MKSVSDIKSKCHVRDVDTFTALLSVIDFIDNELLNIKSLGELKVSLYIWRKTHGWGKISDEIGATELAERTGLDRATVRRSVRQIVTQFPLIFVEEPKIELESGGVLYKRRHFHFSINERVKAIKERASATKKIVEASLTATEAERRPTGMRSDDRRADPQDLKDAPKTSLPAGSGQEWTREELVAARTAITCFLGHEPSEAFEKSIMLACLNRGRGATAAEFINLLKRKWRISKCRPGGKWAPKNENWFFTVIENDFSQGHVVEAPAAPRPEHQTETAAFNKILEALETPS